MYVPLILSEFPLLMKHALSPASGVTCQCTTDACKRTDSASEAGREGCGGTAKSTPPNGHSLLLVLLSRALGLERRWLSCASLALRSLRKAPRLWFPSGKKQLTATHQHLQSALGKLCLCIAQCSRQIHAEQLIQCKSSDF